MKRKVKRLLCGALAALLIFGGALAEEGAPDAEAQAAIEAQQRAEQEAREQAEREARERAEREAREQAEREAREKAEREAKEKAEREAKEKAEREAREKAEREAKEKAEREAKEKAEREAKEKAEREAKEKAEREAKEKAEREAKEKAEREAKEKAEREAKEKAEREAKEKAEAAPADKPKEDKPEEKPVIKEDKPEEKPVVKEDKPEEKPAVKEDKPEEKPSDVQEEKPSAKEDQQEKAPEDKPDPVSEEQPKDAPEGPSEDTPAPAEASPESSEDTPTTAEESQESSEDIPTPAEESQESSEDTPTPAEESQESSEDIPIEVSDGASQENVPAVDESPVESIEASDADASTQSRAEPPAGNAAKPEPVALPDALATEVASAPADIALVPEASKGVTGKDGVYQVAQAMPGKKAAKATLSFPLNYAGECTGYKVSVVDAQGNVVYTGAQTEPAVVLDLSTYKTGSYVLVVEAVSGDAVVAWGQYTFALASGSGFPGGFPGGFGGGFPGGGSGGAPDDTEQAAQGFQVTPGEALAGSHNAGTKDLQRYGTVSLTLSDEAMTELVLGGAALGIVLDGGREAFTAAIDGSRLTLTADGSGVWSFNGRALRILSDSGIETLVLENPAGAHDIATGSPLTGDVYARLCAEGLASSDYDYQVSGDGTRVSVDGRVYRVDDSGAMTPMEGDGYAEAMADAAAGAA